MENRVTNSLLTKRPSSVIDTFEIPDEIARELDQLISRVGVMRDMLAASVDSEAHFLKLQEKLEPIYARYNTLKTLITYQYVPEEYNSDSFSWNYPGYDLTGNTCWIQRT